MSNEKKNGILFQKGTWSLCVTGLNFGLKGLLIKGKEYCHPEDNCIRDENGIDLFIPTSMIGHFKNMGIKIGVPEMNTKQGVSIDDHLRTINLLKAQLEEQDSTNAMKTQLPPELVEKYEKVIDEFDDSESIFRILHLKTKCAKIAVEYADERSRNRIKELEVKNRQIIKQRDELLEALKTVRICSNYKEVKAKHGNCDNWVNIIDELINRIDGKG